MQCNIQMCCNLVLLLFNGLCILACKEPVYVQLTKHVLLQAEFMALTWKEEFLDQNKTIITNISMAN